MVASAIKLPYLSPEARRRKERVSRRWSFDAERSCFTVPANLWNTFICRRCPAI